MAAAASNPRTWLSRSRLKSEPNWRSIRYAAINASPALHTAKATEPAKVRSPNRLATIVAVAAPIATGHRAPGPSAIRAPVATPEAGQKTATPSGFVSRKRPSRAPRKNPMPTATATPIAVTHCRAGSVTARRGSTRLPVNGASLAPALLHQSTRSNRQLEGRENLAMSAFGQKATSTDDRDRSALPPEADIPRTPRHVRKVPTTDSCAAAVLAALFDHLIRARKQRRWDGEPERFGGLEIDC